MAFVTNKKAFLDSLRAAEGEMRRKFSRRVHDVLYTLQVEITALTPVWSGSALANYQWTVGTPTLTYIDPIDNGPPGHTNTMPLGTEPRRSPNESLSLASLEALDTSDVFRVFWLSNNDPDILGLEMGELPPSPLIQRSPNGMIRLSMEFVLAKMASGQM